MSKVKKIIIWIVGVIIAVLAFLWFLGTYGYQIQNYYITKGQERILAQIEENRARLLEAQKNDNHGGKTPEETLDLYISALKIGDIELASRYSEISIEKPNLQKEELDGLKELITRDGDLHVVLENMDNIMKSKNKGYLKTGEYYITYKYLTQKDATSTMMSGNTEYSWLVPGGTEQEISVALRLNPYTKVWKIIQ